MGLFSKAIALETGKTPTAGRRPGLLDRASSTQHENTAAGPASAAVKKKVRKLTNYTSRRSRRNR